MEKNKLRKISKKELLEIMLNQSKRIEDYWVSVSMYN